MRCSAHKCILTYTSVDSKVCCAPTNANQAAAASKREMILKCMVVVKGTVKWVFVYIWSE